MPASAQSGAPEVDSSHGEPAGRPGRRSWSYLAAPLSTYVIVMAPICALQAFLLIFPTPGWMRGSAAVVLLVTIMSFLRGYVRRVVVTPAGVEFRRLGRRVVIPWSAVRRVGAYVPGGGLGSTEYAYVTTRDEPPAGKWDIGPETIQLQNRDGLLNELRTARAQVPAAS